MASGYKCVMHDWQGETKLDICPFCYPPKEQRATSLDAKLAKAAHDGKDDSGKSNPALLFLGLGEVLDAVSKVLDGGAKKYAADSWQRVPNGKRRYMDAFYRHLNDMQVKGWDAINTKDFGLPDIDHAITNLLFVRWFMLQEQKGNNAST